MFKEEDGGEGGLHVLARQLSFAEGVAERECKMNTSVPGKRMGSSYSPQVAVICEGTPISVLDNHGTLHNHSSPLDVTPVQIVDSRVSLDAGGPLIENTLSPPFRPSHTVCGTPTSLGAEDGENANLPSGKSYSSLPRTPISQPTTAEHEHTPSSYLSSASATPSSGTSLNASHRTHTSSLEVSPPVFETPDRSDCITPTPNEALTSPFSSGLRSTLMQDVPATPVRGSTTCRKKHGRSHRSSRGVKNLEMTKMLLTTQLKRSKSVYEPQLFKFNDHFEFERVIGRSKHSEVWQVVKREDRMAFLKGVLPCEPERTAIKRTLRPFLNNSDRDEKMRELSMVTNLGSHKNIVEYYRGWQQDGHINVQMELCAGGSLSYCLQQLPDNKIPSEIIWRFVYETANGLAHIHKSKLLHLDIKPDNIFMNCPDPLVATFKIGDFGLAANKEALHFEDGDGKYVAPELLVDDAKATEAADMYSFGATLYECAVGKHLVRQHAMENRVEFDDDVHGDLQYLIMRMLHTDPASRPTAIETMNFAEQHYQQPLSRRQSLRKRRSVSPTQGEVLHEEGTFNSPRSQPSPVREHDTIDELDNFPSRTISAQSQDDSGTQEEGENEDGMQMSPLALFSRLSPNSPCQGRTMCVSPLEPNMASVGARRMSTDSSSPSIHSPDIDTQPSWLNRVLQG